jgi:hypothetical protein
MLSPRVFRELARSQHTSHTVARRRILRVACCWGTLTCVSAVATGCGLLNDEFTIQVDSLSASNSEDGRLAVVRAVGFLGNGCAEFKRVERSTRGDTTIRRLVGEGSGLRDCIQMPQKVVHEETLVLPPGRAIVYAVRQRDGSRSSLSLGPAPIAPPLLPR